MSMFDDKKTEAVTLKLCPSLLEAADGVAREVLASIFGQPKTGS